MSTKNATKLVKYLDTHVNIVARNYTGIMFVTSLRTYEISGLDSNGNNVYIDISDYQFNITFPKVSSDITTILIVAK